jgi:transposase
MAKTLDKEIVAAIEHAILTAQRTGRHPDLHAIAAIFNCTYQSVCYIRRRIEKHQRTGIDDRKKSGRKPIPEQDRMAASLRELLQKRPELDQSTLSNYLFDEFGKRVCQATISRMLKKNKIPHKISNKLYKRSKLFTAQEGQARVEDNSRDLAASALSELPTASYESYKSPYAPAATPSTDLAFSMAAAANSINMGFSESLAKASNGIVYSNPYE